MTCKECINYDVCSTQSVNCDRANHCSLFKDKSQYKKLPCKVGDTVYYIKAMFNLMTTPKAEKVHKVEIIEGEMIFRTETRTFNEKAINDTVFLDQESAEKALKECEEHV